MRKLLILASLALIGVACSKSDDDNNNNDNAPDPWEEKALLPTKYIIERSKDNITEMVYTIEGRIYQGSKRVPNLSFRAEGSQTFDY